MAGKDLLNFRTTVARALITLLMAALGWMAAGYPAAAATNVSGNITASTTWTVAGSPYIVTGNVTVRNSAVLTIAPGATVKFNAGTGLYVSYSTYTGAIYAVGTQENPITFTSNAANPAPGDWRGIYFDNYTTDASTRLSYCIVEYGGNTTNANIYLDNASPTIQNCTIRHSSAHGIYLNASYPTISDCHISSNQSNGIYSENGTGSHTGMTISGNEFVSNGGAAISTLGYINNITGSYGAGNGQDRIQVRAGNITGSCTWAKQDLPYAVTGNVTIRNGAVLTIAPGATVKFNAGTGLYVSYSTYTGAICAVGTQENPITFTSNAANPAPGDWRGIYFDNYTADASTRLSYCIVEYGGNTINANIYLDNASPIIQNCIIRHSSAHGIYLNASYPTISDCHISSNQSNGIYSENGTGSHTGMTISGNEFVSNGGAAISTLGYINNITGSYGSGNGQDRIQVRAGNITGSCTWAKQDLPYAVAGNVTVRNGAVLTIAPGATVKFNAGTGLYVSYSTYTGAIYAVGTQGNPITFTSNAANPAPGDWRGIYFDNYTTDASTRLSYCIVEYGGNTTNANIYLDNASPTIQNNIIRQSSHSGVYVYGTGCNNAVIDCNNLIENVHGFYAAGSAVPASIDGNNFMNNSGYGAYNSTSTTTVIAGNNWWIGNGTNYNNKVNADPLRTSASTCVEAPPPNVTGITPANGSFFLPANAPQAVVVTFIEYADGSIDLNNSLYAVKDGDGNPVNGAWQLSDDTHLIFTPDGGVFGEAAYTVTIRLQDSVGNQSPQSICHFEVDGTPPEAPVVNPVPARTSAGSQSISGTKEAYASILLNDTEVVAHTALTTWQYTATLAEGANTLVFKAVDRAGNQSAPAAPVEIYWDNVVPEPVTTLSADGNGDGTTVNLSWTYNETAQGGDVDHYAVYRNAPVDGACALTDVSGLTPIATVPSGTTTYQATGLTRGSSYCFALVAVDATDQFNPAVNAVLAAPIDTGLPAEATGIYVSDCQNNSLTFAWTPSASSDLAHHKVFFDGDTTGVVIPAGTNTYTATGLNPASTYTFRIVAVDNDGNVATGVQINAATLIANPTGLSADAHDGYVNLTWSAPALNDSVPVTPFKHYAVYKSTAHFPTVEGSPSVSGLTPVTTTSSTSVKMSNLVNGQTYYFAVVTVNISNGKTTSVTEIPATPQADSQPPQIGAVTFNGTDLSGSTISTSGTIQVAATDTAGISRVVFMVLKGGDTVYTTTDYSSPYTYNMNILTLANGNDYLLRVTVYDTLGNQSVQDFNFNINLPAPAAPQIVSPANGFETNQTVITVTGTAEALSTITYYVNDTPQAETVTTSASRSFSGRVTLVKGSSDITPNVIKARAANRSGQSPDSNSVTVILNTAIPEAPAHLTAAPLEAGKIKLIWDCTATDLAGFNIYRHTASFDSTGGATRVNSVPVKTMQYVDAPTEGLYHYRVTSVSSAGNESLLSNEVTVQSDATGPEAVNITYTPQGPVDSATGAMGPGRVNVTLQVSEALMAAPFFSMAPDGGALIPVELTRLSDTQYAGYFTVSPGTISAMTYAVFSARDKVGNRGSDIQQEEDRRIRIDTRGPEVRRLEVQPAAPIDNNGAVTVTAVFGLDEPISQSLDAPNIQWALSGNPAVPYPIDSLVEIDPPQSDDAQTWQAVFIIPAITVSSDSEDLSFVFEGVDALGNVGTTVSADNQFQIYKGVLPSLAAPTGLSGISQASGVIKLTWNPVDNASGYQIYRRGPNESELAAYGSPLGGNITELVDDSPAGEGSHVYAVTSLRQVNGQTAESARSVTITVMSDSLAPAPPTNLSLTLAANGINAAWTPQNYTEPVNFSLYRAASDITSITNMTPLIKGIPMANTAVVDPQPSLTAHYYVVAAVDAAGNISEPSTSAYLDFSLLPVSALHINQTDLAAPIVSWTPPGNIDGCRIYLGQGAVKRLLAPDLITTNTYTDTGYAGDQRTYTVTAVNAQDVESLERSITLPKVTAGLAAGAALKRGIMNALPYTVTNQSSTDITNMALRVDVTLAGGAVRSHQSPAFSLAAGESKTVSVIVGGYSDLPDVANMTTVIEITEDVNETVEIVRTGEIEVGDGLLGLQLTAETFTRGGEGMVRFSLENTCAEEIELISARDFGKNPSNEVIFYLTDADGNYLAAKNYQCATGSNVVTLSDGTSVIRIPPGGTFESATTALSVSANAPENLTVGLEIGHIYYHYHQADEVVLGKMSTSTAVTLTDTTYLGEITSITPAASTGDTDITISGRALERSTGAPLAGVPLTVVITCRGFERKVVVYTDNSGGFVYLFKPPAGESGAYQVCAVHPELTERPVQGTFVINRVSLQYNAYNLTIPRNDDHTVTLKATAGSGTAVTNLRFEYLAGDQAGGVLPAGVTVSPGAPINLASGANGQVSFSVQADDSAADNGQIVLRLVSDNGPAGGWATLPVNLHLIEAQPALWYSPDYVETGVNLGTSVTETVTLENKGYADLEGVSLSLVDAGGNAAPNWIYIASSAQVGNIKPGAASRVDIVFAPPSSQAQGIYSHYLRVSSLNHAAVDILLRAIVTTDVTGRALFKVSDIYTGTPDDSGTPIYGLAGARITLRNEATMADYTLTTDAQGEALSGQIPVGSYLYRIRAANHEEASGRIWIKPGITQAQEVFLTSQLVTVEWEVVETTIVDRYDIIYTAKFETDVPAAVVVADPVVVPIPSGMKVGDVMNGEITLTNHGLIRADDVVMTPPSSKYYRVEYLGVPDSILPHQSVSVPYRITCLQVSGATGEEGTGGLEKCCTDHRACGYTSYTYTCANGTTLTGSFMSCYTWKDNCFFAEKCIDLPTEREEGEGSIDPDKLDMINKDLDELEKGEDGLFGGDFAAACAPKPDCPEPDEETCEIKSFYLLNGTMQTGSEVDLLHFTYTREDTDLTLQVPGGRFELARQYRDKQWDWGLAKYNLKMEYSGSQIDVIDKDSIKYRKATGTPTGVKALFTNNSFKIAQQMDDTFVWSSRFGDVKYYNAQGRLTAVGDATGIKRYLLYDGQQHVSGFADSNNQQFLWLTYDGSDRIIEAEDNQNRRVSYTYDPQGLLATVTDVDNRQTAYTYDAEGRLTTVTLPADPGADPNGYTITYNDMDMVKSVQNGQGEGKFFSYNYFPEKKEHYAAVQDSAGQLQEIWYDESGYVRRRDSNGQTLFNVEKIGRTERTTLNGRVTIKYFDEWGDIVKIEYPDGSSVSRQYDRVFHRKIRETDENGHVTAYGYDAEGRMIQKTEAAGTDDERVTRYTYDAAGNLTETRVIGTPDIVTTMTYDSLGNQTSVTDPEGHTTTFTHDLMGNVLTRIDDDNHVWTYTYDASGNMLTAEDPLHRVVAYEYDASGRKTKEIGPDDRQTRFEYDLVGNLVRQIQVLNENDPSQNLVTQFAYAYGGKLTGTIDPEGAVTDYEYDSRGRLVKTIDAAGNETVTEYGDAGASGCSSCSGGADQPMRITYPTFSKAFTYDERNRKAAEQDIISPSSSTGGYTVETRFGYDPVGNLIEKTDKDGRITYYEYDALNRLVRVTDPASGQTSYTYDNRNNLVSLTDAEGQTTNFAYDLNNRLTRETRPEGQQTTYAYNDSGSLSEKLDAKGQRAAYTYDAAGQMTETRYYDAGNVLVKTVTFTYDNAGRLTGYEDKNGAGITSSSAAYVYDAAGRKTGETINFGDGTFSKTHSYAYLKNGLKESFTGPDNVTYGYLYDTANRLAGVQIPDAGFISVNDYSWNRPSGMTLPGGAVKEFSYDPLMRISQITAKDPGANELLNYNYTHDNMDNITAKTTEHGDYGYAYDALHRLTDVDNPEAVSLTDEAFTYDGVGNRLTSADRDGAWAYNENNELLSLPSFNEESGSGGLQAASYEYDANGNTVKKTVDGVVFSYVYNTEDRLAQVWNGLPNSGTLTASYYYDPFGRRLWKDVGGAKTYFHYADEGLVAEIDASGTVVKAYGWQPGGTWGTDPLFMKSGGSYYFYHNDHLGTPQKLTARSGEVVWSATYESFGKAVVEVETVENNLRFPGQYYDEETGLHYNWWRYYEPGTGRYLRTDPNGVEGGVNFYVYASSEPINHFDSEGLETCGSGWNEALVPDNPFNFQFSDCCVAHDECYGTCGNSQRQCDDNFESCMLGSCSGITRPMRQSVCRTWARRYANAVRRFGATAFNNAQEHCSCITPPP
ncbi:MAG: right-handed parallel beta-helix repeat-containing protein [Thermodesulfobacteriota bacterium]